LEERSCPPDGSKEVFSWLIKRTAKLVGSVETVVNEIASGPVDVHPLGVSKLTAETDETAATAARKMVENLILILAVGRIS